MLYKTTRSDNDTYTVHRVLHENHAIDGGAFIPFRMPSFTASEIEELFVVGFSGTVASILNKFFSCHLTGWDVDFCIGRSALKLEEMTHRMVVAELWHNPDGNYEYICASLYNKICATVAEAPTDWFTIASHISVLFGIYSEMRKEDIISAGDRLDITILANDLTASVATVYARQMGLPLGTIILSCEDNGNLWDMIHLGELTVSAWNTDPTGLERLVLTTMGKDATEDLRAAMLANKTYRVSEDQLPDFNRGLFCSVVGKDRGKQNINSIYRSNGYFMDTTTALTVAGLQDYRAKTGASQLTLVLSCTSPQYSLDCISNATGIAQDKLSMLLKNPCDRRK